MSNLSRLTSALIVAGLAASGYRAASGAPPATAIAGARLIDGTGALPVDDAIVVVDAQRKARLREQSYPFIKAMSEAGVRVVTGTDCGAEASQVTPFGHATHRELQLFVEAGLSPLAAIRAATLDAARVISRSENPDYGSVAAGKIADLLLLDADPTVDINNTIKIARVMRAGRWIAMQAMRSTQGQP